MNSKKIFEFPTAFTVLIILAAVACVLTYVIPAGSYDYVRIVKKEVVNADGTKSIQDVEEIYDENSTEDISQYSPKSGSYHRLDENHGQGIADFFLSSIRGFSDAWEVILFVLMIGGFIGLVNKTGALDAGIANVMQNFKGREHIMIIVVFTLITIGGTTEGMEEETTPFYLIILPMMIASGYDALLGIGTIWLGSRIGGMGSTINPFATGVGSEAAGIGIGEGFFSRVIILAVLYCVTLMFLLRYAKRIKKDPTKSIVHDIPECSDFKTPDNIPEFNKKRKIVLWLFVITFLFMIFSLLPWDSWGLEKIYLGWYFQELSALFIFASVFVGLLYGMKEKDIVDNFMDGARDLLGVALVIAVARGLSLIMKDGQIQDTILYWCESALQHGGKVVFSSVVFLLNAGLAILIPSSSGLAGLTIPIMAPLADLSEVPRHIVVTAYQLGLGLMNIIAITNGTLVAALTIGKIPYNRWLKFVMGHILTLVVTSIILLTLVTIFS